MPSDYPGRRGAFVGVFRASTRRDATPTENPAPRRRTGGVPGLPGRGGLSLSRPWVHQDNPLDVPVVPEAERKAPRERG